MKHTNPWMSAALAVAMTVAMAIALAVSDSAQAAQPAAPAVAAAPAAAPADTTADTERQLEAARQRLDAAAREVAELSGRLGENVGQRFMRRGFAAPRAMLGVQIDGRPGAGGAHVMAVSPGGAAATSGIEADDVITAIDGEDLSKVADPSRALVERMRTLNPDTKVKLRVVHAGKAREVEVTPRGLPPGMMAFGGPMPPMPGMRPMPPMPPMPPMAGYGARERMRGHERGPADGPQAEIGPFWGERRGFQGLELATLSPRLGGYFGAKNGVLVVRAGGTALKLEDGDVITAVDSREATSAAHVTRILRSYQPGEKVAIKLVRDHKAQQVDVVMARD